MITINLIHILYALCISAIPFMYYRGHKKGKAIGFEQGENSNRKLLIDEKISLESEVGKLQGEYNNLEKQIEISKELEKTNNLKKLEKELELENLQKNIDSIRARYKAEAIADAQKELTETKIQIERKENESKIRLSRIESEISEKHEALQKVEKKINKVINQPQWKDSLDHIKDIRIKLTEIRKECASINNTYHNVRNGLFELHKLDYMYKYLLEAQTRIHASYAGLEIRVKPEYKQYFSWFLSHDFLEKNYDGTYFVRAHGRDKWYLKSFSEYLYMRNCKFVEAKVAKNLISKVKDLESKLDKIEIDSVEKIISQVISGK